jgi:tellurium resistance protein TerD
MGISLQKGHKADLTKGNTGISKIKVGLGWDQASQKKLSIEEDTIQTSKGLINKFGKALKSAGSAVKNAVPIDCDASVFLLDANGKLSSNSNLIYFGNKRSNDGSVIHSGDNLTGKGEGDDESISVDLDKIPANIDKLVFVVNIFGSKMKGQHFGMINNAFIRVVDERNGEEILRYNLSSDYDGKTGLLVGEIYRRGIDWKFNALGEGTTDKGLEEMARRFK